MKRTIKAVLEDFAIAWSEGPLVAALYAPITLAFAVFALMIAMPKKARVVAAVAVLAAAAWWVTS